MAETGRTFLHGHVLPVLDPVQESRGWRRARGIFRDGTRIAIYVVYNHVRQSMTELAMIDGKGGEILLEMKLNYYFPREISQAMQEAGLAAPRIAGVIMVSRSIRA